MSNDLWVSVSGAIAQQKNIDTIANNVSNANTPGFKKDQLVFKEYLTHHNKIPSGTELPTKIWAPKHFYQSQGAEKGFVKTDGQFTLFEQGQLTPTHNPLDLALFGKGFFEILTPLGIRYTRKGNFTLNSNGEIVTDQGNQLLSARTEGSDTANITERVIKIDTKGPFSISQNGQIYQGESIVGQLSVVDFKDPHTLKKEGSALYINNYSQNIIRNNLKTKVHQGFLEESNVNSLEEMSSLIKAHRQFESIQKAIKIYDQISGKAVNDISKF